MNTLELLFCAVNAIAVKAQFHLAASNKSYGPDGPWNAVRIGLGAPPQPLDMYPIGAYQSIVYSKEICRQYQNLTCGTGGFFNAAQSESFDNKSISAFQPYDRIDGSARSVLDTLTLGAATNDSTKDVEVSNFSLALFFSDSLTLPDGSVYPTQVGHLSLISSLHSQTFYTSQKVKLETTASLILGTLQDNGVIDSNSFGLHYGSASFTLPLSLWLGGFDSSRILGPVAAGPAAQNAFQIDLLDIGFGVDSGASPFSLAPKQGILPPTAPLTVQIDADVPYLSLPFGVCQKLAESLPVTLQPKYGIYFWNTGDLQYSRIITSPSYLKFTFRAPLLSQGNLTINVPFRLLNLTLSSLLIATPTSFFPCAPTPSTTLYTLGRTFLQAEFLGVNWSKKPGPEWYLAQAPGPGILPSPSGVLFGENVTGHSSNWAETWKNNWTPLADSSLPSAISSSSTLSSTAATAFPLSNRTSVGTKAGIAVGCIIVAGLVLGAALFLLRRSRRKLSTKNSADSASIVDFAAHTDRVELDHRQAPMVLPERIYEASDPEPIQLSQLPPLSHELHTNGEIHEAPVYHTSF